MPFAFDDCRMDSARRELWRGGEIVTVEPGVFDLLEYLVRNRERVVTKDELIERVWQGRNISESTLSSRVTAARHAIGDSGEAQRLIRTVPRKGVRFVADVVELAPGPAIGLHGEAEPFPSQIEKPSIAVLPFANLSEDRAQEYFSDGISEDLIMSLSRLRWFFVIARNSSFAYKGQALDVRQIGQALGVAYLLDGSVRRLGNKVRVSCQLLDATTGNNLWVHRYDREMTDLFVLQDEIIAQVVAAIEPELVAAESQRAARRTPDQLVAWDLVAQAMPHFWKFTAEDTVTAIGVLRQAVDRHSDYAPANSMLAFALMFAGWQGWHACDRADVVRLATRAVALDPNDPWGHMAMGFMAMTEGDTDEALRHFSEAQDLNPNFVPAVGFAGFAMALDGRTDEALACFDRCMQMNPRDPYSNVYLAPMGAAYYLAGDYDEAIRWSQQSIRLNPSFLGGYRVLAASLGQAGRKDEAQAALATLRERQPDISLDWVRRWVPYSARRMDTFLDGLRKAGLD